MIIVCISLDFLHMLLPSLEDDQCQEARWLMYTSENSV